MFEMISADFPVDGSSCAKDAKSALRDAIHAKLKTSKFGDEKQYELNNYVPSSNLSTPEHEAFDALDEDSDSNDDIEGKLDDKDSVSNVPIEERRLRNRLAARKCREKRKQRIIDLEKICSNLEGRISTLQNEIDGLDVQKQNLSKALENHTCVKISHKPTAVITNNLLRKNAV